MTTEVVTTTKNNAVTNVAQNNALTSNLDTSDISMPRLHLLQPMSQGVGEEFQAGQIVHTGTQEAVGDKDSPVMFIPFSVMKVNQKFRTDVSPKEYICTEAFDAGRPWQEEGYVWTQYGGNTVKCLAQNYKTFIVHGLLEDDDSGMALPVSITLKSSAGRGVKPLTNHFATMAQFNAMRGTDTKPYSHAWELTSEMIKTDNQKYYAWRFKKARQVTAEEIEACDLWAESLNSNAMKYADAAATQQDQAPMLPKENSATIDVGEQNLQELEF
jgi:hypothetical protein